MAEASGELRSQLRVIRTVRRAQFVGSTSGEAVGGTGVSGSNVGSLATSGLALAVTAAELGPAVGVALGGLIVSGILQQFFQPSIDQFVLPDNLYRPWEYSDKIRKLTLEKIFGTEKGDIVWNAEWSQRSINVDLRTRAP